MTTRAGWAADAAAIGLITAAVVESMREMVFSNRIANADPLALWLPVWTYLGRALRDGHIPLWQTGIMGGAPFAADSQSGWGYIEPSVLFATLSPDHAIRAMLVLQPLTAGIGLYVFLRLERLPRWAACCGGLALALAITGSTLVDALPFSASLAWTTVTLVACARLLAARTWARRLVWMVPTAIAWGQIAAAHAGLGLLMGTITIAAYVVWKLAVDVRAGTISAGLGVAVAAVLAVSAGAVNLAFFAPRLAYVDETSLGIGYSRLEALGRLLNHVSPETAEGGAGWGWPLKFSAPPGAYLGGAILIGVMLAFAARYRRLTWTFVTATVVLYVASLQVFADLVPDAIARLRPVDLYLHAPFWLGYELTLTLAVLAAIGLTAWPRTSDRTRWTAVGVAVVVWLVLPVILGIHPLALGVALVGMAVTVGALEAGRRRPPLLWLVPCVLALELLVAGTFAQPYPQHISVGPEPPRLTPGTVHFAPVILHRSPFEAQLTAPGTGRVVVINSEASIRAAMPDGVINGRTEPAWLLNWPLLTGAQGAGGYNAVELRRYWVAMRALGGAPINYEHANFSRVPLTLGNLLRVQWVLRPTGSRPQPAEVAVNRAGAFTLYRRPAPPAASLLPSWDAVAGPVSSLAAVRRRGFDPNREAVIEAGPDSGGHGPAGAAAGAARYQAGEPGHATVYVHAPRRELLLVRTPYASGWHATIDGAAAAVVPTDYLDQGVIVPAGRHVVRLTFTDPWVMRGLVGSAAAILILLLAAGGAAWAQRKPASM